MKKVIITLIVMALFVGIWNSYVYGDEVINKGELIEELEREGYVYNDELGRYYQETVETYPYDDMYYIYSWFDVDKNLGYANGIRFVYDDNENDYVLYGQDALYATWDGEDFYVWRDYDFSRYNGFMYID